MGKTRVDGGMGGLEAEILRQGSLFRRDRGRGAVRRTIRAWSLDLRAWNVRAARPSIEMGTLLECKALGKDVTLHMALRLESDVQAPDRSDLGGPAQLHPRP